MERDVMDIVKEKEFIELTASERTELGELCSSEEEFNQVKAMFAGIGAMDWSNPAPKAETKESLDHLFAQKHANAAPVWYNAPLALLTPKGKPFYRQPLVQAAAVGLLIFLAYPFVNSNVMTSESSELAVLKKEDTSSEMKETDVQMKEDQSKLTETNEIEQNEISVDTRYKSFTNEVIVTTDVVSAPAPASPTRSVNLIASKVTSVTSPAKDFGVIRGTAGDVSAQPGSTHPDGIFVADKNEIFSVPASREPAVFDLLTSTF